MKFFVVVRTQKGYPLPMVEGKYEDDVKLFDTREEAEQAGEKNLFGETFGYEIYEWQ